MKNRIIAMCLFLTALWTTTLSQSAWTPISTGTVYHLKGMASFTTYTGTSIIPEVVVVGDAGTVLLLHEDGKNVRHISDPSVTADFKDVTVPWTDSIIISGNRNGYFRLNHFAGDIYTFDTTKSPPLLNGRTIHSIDSRLQVPVIFCAGDSGLLFRSSNLGASGSWTSYSAGVKKLNAIQYVKSNAVYVVGDSGTLLKGALGGSYVQKTPPFAHRNVSYNSVCFLNDTGWVVGTGGAIGFTSNGGVSWVAQHSGVTADLHSIYTNSAGARANAAWAVGDSGVIIATTDYGATWIRQESGTDVNLWSIAFTPGGYGYVSGDNGVLLMNSMGGVGIHAGVSISSFDFGQVIRGRTVVRSFAINNPLTVPMSVGGFSSDNASFTIEPVDTVIQPMTSILVGLRYSPAALRTDSGFVHFTAAGEPFEISLTGEGIDSLGSTSFVWKNPLPQGSIIRHLAFTDESHLVGVGDGGTIIRSGDGGLTWQMQSYLCGLPGRLRSITFPAQDTGYIIDENGSLYKTLDGGGNWSQLPHGIADRLVSIWFSDGLTGYVVAGSDSASHPEVPTSGGIYKTTDGGSTWSAVYVTPQNGAGSVVRDFPLCVSGHGGNTIFAGGRERGGQGVPAGFFFRSDDGGITWTRSHILVPLLNLTMVPNCINFYDNMKGIIAGSSGLIFRTNDGGVTWNYFNQYPSSPMQALGLGGTSRAILAGSAGQILLSTDAGTTWNSLSLSGTINWTAAAINNSGVVVLAGTDSLANASPSRPVWHDQSGNLYRSADNGLTWTSSSGLAGNHLLNSVASDRAGHITAVGDAGSIVQSADSGRTWSAVFDQSIFQYLNLSLNAIASPTQGKLTTAGDRGIILVSSDGGESWFDQPSGTTASIQALSFTDSMYGWAAGSSGTILMTTDAGAHWSNLSGIFGENLSGICFGDRLHGIAVSLEGTILRTSDGGLNWSGVSMGRTLLGVALKSDTGYVPGFGSVYLTTDGGINWTETVTGVNRYLTGIFMQSGTTAVVTGDDGLILETTDCGMTWSVQPTGTVLTLTSAFLTESGAAVVVGAGGAILFSETMHGTISAPRSTNRGRSPNTYFLGANYPNPFNPTTSVSFGIGRSSLVSLRVYDILGREVATLANEMMEAGEHSVQWNAAGMPSGVYFYRMTAGSYSAVRKMVLIR